MKYVMLVVGIVLGFALGVGFGPTVKAYWEEREARAANDVLDRAETALADLDAMPERRAILLNERVDLATDLAIFRSYKDVEAEPHALEQLHRLFAVEHEIIELDERERWLRETRDALVALRGRLASHLDGSHPIPDDQWPAIQTLLDGAPTSTPPRPSAQALQRLFDSLGGA